LVHDGRSAAGTAVEVLAAREAYGRHAIVGRTEGGKLRRAADGVLGRVTGRQRTDQTSDHASAHQAAQVCLNPLLASSHGTLSVFLQLFQTHRAPCLRRPPCLLAIDTYRPPFSVP